MERLKKNVSSFAKEVLLRSLYEMNSFADTNFVRIALCLKIQKYRKNSENVARLVFPKTSISPQFIIRFYKLRLYVQSNTI